MNNPILEIKSLSLSIHNSNILKNISGSIGRGEVWSIVGPNGAGKSTLLKCLMRIHTGWKGEIQLLGKTLKTYSQRDLARLVSFVPQAGENQNFPFTVQEFVRMGRYAYSGLFGFSHPGDESAVNLAIAKARIEKFIDRTLDTLSGGERQKVFIAAALAQGGQILLLDEPTTFLDYRHQAEIMEILKSINQDSKTTIINVTHDVNAAILSGGKVMALKDGRVIWTGTSEEMLNEGLLRKIFDASFRFIDDPQTGLKWVAPQGAGR